MMDNASKPFRLFQILLISLLLLMSGLILFNVREAKQQMESMMPENQGTLTTRWHCVAHDEDHVAETPQYLNDTAREAWDRNDRAVEAKKARCAEGR